MLVNDNLDVDSVEQNTLPENTTRLNFGIERG
jgi:hypothetical protein